MPRLIQVSIGIVLVFFFIFNLSQAQNAPEAYQLIQAENLTELEVVAEFPCEGRSPSAAFRGDFFATSCRFQSQGLNRIYSLTTREELWQFSGGSRDGLGIQFLSDDVLLTVGVGDFSIYRQQEAESFTQETYLHASIAISPDGSHIAFITGSPLEDAESNPILIYRLPDFELVEFSLNIEGHVQSAKLALSNADASLIAIAEYGGRIRIFNWETGELVTEIADSPFITTVAGEYGSGDFSTTYAWFAFSPDASELLSNQCSHMEMGCWEMAMIRFDVATGEVLASAKHYNGGAFSDPVFIWQSRLLLHSTGCDGPEFYDLDSLSELESSIPSGPPCPSEYDYAANDEGTLISVYDEANTQFLLYGIPAE